MTDPDTLDAVATAAVGHPLDQLTAAEAIDVADRLRAVVDALAPPPSSADSHLAAQLADAAELIEKRAGIT